MRYPILLLTALLAACATTGSNDGSITIDTRAGGQQLAGANCMVSTNSGSWNVVTPATVPVGSANGDLRVVCNKPGYRTAETLYRPAGSSGSSLGLGVGGGGGHVGVGLGIGVPIQLGSRGYPGTVTVDMNPQ
ncbi:hypothetical protein [Noviherbaspirillum galbum]|uniref:Lipoprotein n=1 Tax=Noviherbaspirillum galbum TaxID=2709383 RepID=A0A6B3SP06_9BURK|nr:hypothetical protein [Noviherbaspirillum galbum]NEX62600.1 hypothetical protein [Noviherbaspirillum galbum]